MHIRKVTQLILSLLIVLGVLLSACAQTVETEAPSEEPAAEEPAAETPAAAGQAAEQSTAEDRVGETGEDDESNGEVQV